MLADYGVSDGGRWSRLGDQQWRDSVRGKDFGCDGAEGFAQKSGIASHDDSRSGGLLRNYVTCNSLDRAAHIGKGELLGHDRSPSRGAEFDLQRHGGLSLRVKW